MADCVVKKTAAPHIGAAEGWRAAPEIDKM